jgi:hypothetical protein
MTIETDTIIEFRIPGDLFREVTARTFSFPPVAAEYRDAMFAVTARVEGIDEPVDLLDDFDVDYDDVVRAVERFNADPAAGWQKLLDTFFREQRQANADRRAELEQDDSFLLDLEAGFLR